MVEGTILPPSSETAEAATEKTPSKSSKRKAKDAPATDDDGDEPMADIDEDGGEGGSIALKSTDQPSTSGVSSLMSTSLLQSAVDMLRRITPTPQETTTTTTDTPTKSPSTRSQRNTKTVALGNSQLTPSSSTKKQRGGEGETPGSSTKAKKRLTKKEPQQQLAKIEVRLVTEEGEPVRAIVTDKRAEAGAGARRGREKDKGVTWEVTVNCLCCGEKLD